MKSKELRRPLTLVFLFAALQALTGCAAETDESWEEVGETEQSASLTGTYMISSRQSGKCLDVTKSNRDEGGNIQLWRCNLSNAQKFFRVHHSGNIYVYMNVNSRKCIDVAGAAHWDGANVQQWSCNASGAQLFYEEETEGGYKRIINVNSGRALDVANWGTYDGANIQQWAYGGGKNQQWVLFPVP
jgi:hypothetical protein